LFVDNMARHILALGGDTVVHAFGVSVEILRVTPAGKEQVTSFDVDVDVDWLSVAPDGQSALIWGGWARRLWRWRAGAGHQLIATNSQRGDDFGGGFAIIRGETTMFVAQHGDLRGFGIDGRNRLTANLGTPRNFKLLSITNLPGNRLALYGNEASDPYRQIYTVYANDLLNDPDSFQKAIRPAAPVNDRAWRLMVGPCAPDSAVVFRDPDDLEIPDDDDDLEAFGDVGNFTGVYIRNLDSGELVERIPYNGQVISGVRILATPRLVALEVEGGIDLISRGSGEVREIRALAATLDVNNMRAARLMEGGHIEIRSIDELDSIVKP
jgi:hypothetical protein